jgi:hypothetical protein
MDEDERQTRDELMILDALVQAMDRRDEVFQIIEESEDVDEARRRVGQLLVSESCPARQSSTCRLEDSPETSVRPSLPVQKNLDQSCLMAAEDFVFSVDYWRLPGHHVHALTGSGGAAWRSDPGSRSLGPAAAGWEDLDLVTNWRSFLDSPERYLRHI